MASSMPPMVFPQQAFDESDVSLLNTALPKGLAELRVGGVILGDQNDAGGFFVEAMNDSRAQRIAALRQRLPAAE